jgi:hypothetical protein
MQYSQGLRPPKSDLVLPWLVTGMMFLMLMVYIVISQVMGDQLQQHWPEEQRILIRSVLYGCAIVTFPITNLIRHIQLRLNETMPGEKTAKMRYFLTTTVSMALIESVGVLGFVMFLLGDGYNTLYIFTGLSTLGMFLYRPKADEYARIYTALALKKKESDSRDSIRD